MSSSLIDACNPMPSKRVSACSCSTSQHFSCHTQSYCSADWLYCCRDEPSEQTLLRRGAPSCTAESNPGRVSATRCSTAQSMATAGYTHPTSLHPDDSRPNTRDTKLKGEKRKRIQWHKLKGGKKHHVYLSFSKLCLSEGRIGCDLICLASH